MKIIIITLPEVFDGETVLVNRLFREEVISRLHLRKPEANEKTMAEWIEQIDITFRHRIVLHDHHDLALRYQLGGIHLNGRNPHAPEWVTTERARRFFTLSRSCHSLQELEQYSEGFDYLFLSPIFDSISKQGYRSAFSTSELRIAESQGFLTDKVYALGGVTPDNLEKVERLGFGGAAMLGAFWKQYI